jgi:hypothetical protein
MSPSLDFVMGRQGKRVQLRPLMVVIVASVVVLTVLVGRHFPSQDKDLLFWSRLYLAKAHVEAIGIAAEAFHTQRGTYTANLAELVGAKLLVKMADAPWGTSYHYEVEQGRGGEQIRIWTIPDRTTQERIGLSELSNRTDWSQVLKP